MPFVGVRIGIPSLVGGVKGILLSNATFSAGSVQTTPIGTLSVVGSTGTFVFTLTNTASSKVQVAGTNGVNLQAGSAAASAGTFSIGVHATNGTISFDSTFVITAVNLTLAASFGSFVLTGEPVGLGISISMPAAQGSFTLTGEAATLTVTGIYAGPGDTSVSPGALAWYGLQGYTAAYSDGTHPSCDIVDQAGANPLTVNIKSDGTLDVAAINTWVTAHSVTTIKVAKLYDQTGNGIHVVQATLANMPSLVLTGTGTSNGPSLTSNGSQTLASSATLTASGVFTFAAVGKRTSGASLNTLFGANNFPGLWFDGTNQPTYYAGNIVHNSGVENAFHTMQAMFNHGATTGASYIDGAAGTSADPGGGGISGQSLVIFGPFALTGGFVCGGVWDGDKSSKFAAVDSNIRTFWGI